MQTMVNKRIATNGERFSIMMDRNTGLPVYYPNLFITTQIRGRNCAANTCDKYLRILQILHEFELEENIEIIDRVKKFDYLNIYEIDNLITFCKRRFDKAKLIPIGYSKSVSPDTTHDRINLIAEYINWLAMFITPSINNSNNLKLEQFISKMKSKSPSKSNRNINNKSLDKLHRFALLKIIHPKNKNNPSVNQGVKYRNFISILILYELGLRKSELLSIRIGDINAQDNTISVVIEPDAIDDPRVDQPVPKTNPRTLPVSNRTMSYIIEYITKYRREIANSRTSAFLIVTHKKQESQGWPLSISGFDKMFSKYVRAISHRYPHFSPHHLRHTANDIFSERFEISPYKESIDPDYIRSTAMGWKPGTSTSATYSQGYITKNALKKGLQYQKKINKSEK